MFSDILETIDLDSKNLIYLFFINLMILCVHYDGYIDIRYNTQSKKALSLINKIEEIRI